jgi:phosphoadenosine phosphosulfate reductase
MSSTSSLFGSPYDKTNMINDDESGYASGSSSHETLPEVYFSKPHLKFLNAQLQQLEPQGMSALWSFSVFLT